MKGYEAHDRIGDRYDVAYRRGYADGYARIAKRPPSDDSDVNYADGYADGAARRQYDGEDGDA